MPPRDLVTCDLRQRVIPEELPEPVQLGHIFMMSALVSGLL